MNRTQRGKLGGFTQAGTNMLPAGYVHPLTPTMGMLRAVVLNTFVSEDADASTVYRVECDVLVVRSNVVLRRVAVSQPVHGVNDAELWIPKPSTRSLVTNAPFSLSPVGSMGTQGLPATLPSDLDGDHVLIAPIENDHGKYVILRALSHPRTKRKILGANGNPVSQVGWEASDNGSSRGAPARHEYYRRHQGTEIRVNGKGDVLIDTVGATQDAENETPSTDAGQIRMRVKDSQRFFVELDGTSVLEVYKQGSQVRIDLGTGATERLLLGDSFLTFFNSHTHPTGTGPSGTPTTPMTDSLLSDLAKTKKT